MKMNGVSFFGMALSVGYDPGRETVDDVRFKLEQRMASVSGKLKRTLRLSISSAY